MAHHLPKPHLPVFVSELAALGRDKAPAWDGRRVRVLGRLRMSQDQATLESIAQIEGNEEGIFIKVSFIINPSHETPLRDEHSQ